MATNAKRKKRRPMEPTVERLSDKCISVSFAPSGTEWTVPVLLASDQHFDSAHADRRLIKKHLDEVVEANGRALFLGDWFDSMQGSRDKRSSKGALLPQYKRSDYLNALVEDSVAFLEPYAPYIAGWAEGNHETSILRHTEFDLLGATINELNLRTGSDIQRMGYSGWVFIRYLQYSSGLIDDTKKIYYTHGSGGGGPVTKGVIATNRRATFLPDADIICSGHIHEAWSMEMRRERINRNGTVYGETQYHLQLPTYKDEFAGDGSGWWHETGKAPRPMGGWFVDLGRKKNNNFWTYKATPRRAE